MKYTKLLILPKTNVPNKFPNICDDIMNTINNANISLFLYLLATLLVYAPCATHNADAENPQMLAPAQTKIHTNVWLISTFVTISNPVA